jgi:alpha-tubulin suppressor-like RCC1 family protein
MLGAMRARRRWPVFMLLTGALALGTSITFLACSSFDETDGPPPPSEGGADASGDATAEALVDVISSDSDADAGPTDPVIDLRAGTRTACALRRSGRVLCWGSNAYLTTGQPMAGDLACDQGNCRLPLEVPGLASITQVSMGADFACARRADGAVLCWGANTFGTLGNGTTSPPFRAEAMPVSALAPALDVVAGAQSACARVMEDGGIHVYCWGSNTTAMLATTGDFVSVARRIPELDGALAIRLSVTFPIGCAILADHRVVCWGRNLVGSLGHAPSTSGDTSCMPGIVCNPTPTEVGNGTLRAKDVEPGYVAACALTMADGIVCWGDNEFGQLGSNLATNLDPHPDPSAATGLASVTAISMRSGHACAIVAGTPWCWGINQWGEIGDALGGTTCASNLLCDPAPVKIDGMPELAQISTGEAFTLARAVDGKLFAWGDNTDARLGHLPSKDGDLAQCGQTMGRCNPKPTPLELP